MLVGDYALGVVLPQNVEFQISKTTKIGKQNFVRVVSCENNANPENANSNLKLEQIVGPLLHQGCCVGYVSSCLVACVGAMR